MREQKKKYIYIMRNLQKRNEYLRLKSGYDNFVKDKKKEGVGSDI